VQQREKGEHHEDGGKRHPPQLVEVTPYEEWLCTSGHRLSIVWDDADRLGELNAGAFAKTAANAFVGNMWLFQSANRDGHILQRAGPVAHTAGLSLKRQAELFVNASATHADAFNDGFRSALNFLNGPARADVAALHAQDATLIAWNYVGRVDRVEPILQAKITNASVGADLSALATMDACAQEVFFWKRPWRT